MDPERSREMSADELLSSGADLYWRCLSSLKQLDGLAERPGYIPAHMPYPQQFNRPVLSVPCHQRPIQPRIIQPQPLYALARNVGFFPYAQPLASEPVMYSSNNLNYAYINPSSLPQMPYNRFVPHANDRQPSASIQCRYNEAQRADQNGLRASLFTRHSTFSVPASMGSPAGSLISDDAADRNGNGPPTSGSAGNEKRQPITRPMNSFMLYSKVHRHKVHSLYPHLDNRTVSKLLGETWYLLEQTYKMKYAILAANMKKEHTLQPPIDLASQADSEMPDSPTSGATESIIVVEDDDDKDVVGCGVVESEPLDLKMSPGGAQRTEKRPSRNEEADAQCGAICRRPWAPAQSIFHLDPTPAQVKRAQMTGRKPVEASNSSVSAVTSAMAAEQSFTQRMLSKFECEIEKLPQFDFSNYQLPDWAKKSLRPSSPRIEPYNKRNKSDDSHNKKRRRFFGDDFDQAGTHKGRNDTLALHVEATGSKGGKANDTNTPRRSDRQKELIMHLFRTKGFFPPTSDIDAFLAEHREFGTKQYLNLKIREYRQKFMRIQAQSRSA